MTRRHVIAILVACAAMLAVLGPPLWVRVTGDEVTLAIRPVDPLSLFRGNYIDLVYPAARDADPALVAQAVSQDGAVYVVFEDRRPGVLRRIERDRPKLADDEFCVQARADGGSLDFPQLEQFFVTPERGREIERNLSDMVAVIKVTGGCRSVLVDLEPRRPASG
jgi:uncharacterized membrane-anchored protein